MASRHPPNYHGGEYGRSRRRSCSQERPQNVVFDPPLLGHEVFYKAPGYQAGQDESYTHRKGGLQPLLRLLIHVSSLPGWPTLDIFIPESVETKTESDGMASCSGSRPAPAQQYLRR